MTSCRPHQRVMLALTCAGVLFTVGRFSLDSTAGKRPVNSFTFPSVVPLPGWQLLESRSLASPIASKTNSYEAVLTSQQYRYSQNYQQIEVKMLYTAGTLGNFQSYLIYFTPIQLQQAQLLQNLRYQKEIGFHKLFVYQGRSHLVACINPRGGSTVTHTQFFANRRKYDLQLQRLFPWLLGKESLIDRRCLWTHMSIPLSQTSAETTYPVLEKAWRSWYQWWSHHFPQH